jgi:hypothetical protein
MEYTAELVSTEVISEAVPFSFPNIVAKVEELLDQNDR